jgi:hypothetical protein
MMRLTTRPAESEHPGAEHQQPNLTELFLKKNIKSLHETTDFVAFLQYNIRNG